ncbi:MAG: nucleotidyltransferase domain-containing protein [bacterium]|nr:nucleotidyltransferase domain-containing protein [bacterium]
MNMKISSVEKTIIPVLRKYGVSQASLFGSIVRDEMKNGSDIDILVKLPDNIHGFDYIDLRLNLQEELEKKLKRKVDLVEFDYIKSSLKKYILTGQRLIYAK